ncbi:MAG TPA: UbiA family prenyltransferase [bacterium]|nr:UbiA family prenyltransferase [bacterium]
MIGGRHTPLDYLFFLRPVLLPPVWTIALLGTLPTPADATLPPLRWALFFVQLAALFGGVYTLNQICDIESDRLNRKLFFLPEGLISPRAAGVFTAALDLVALALALPFGWPYLAITGLIMALGIVYSVGRRAWKNRPYLALIANGIGHGAAVYVLGSVFAGRPWMGSWMGALAYTLAVGAVYLATTVPDCDGDAATGKRTFAVRWGARATMIIAAILVTLAVVVAARIGDRYLAFAGAAAWPFFLRGIVKSGGAATAAKAAVAALSVSAVIAYPFYLALLVAGFIGTRLFFRWRFGIAYPTFP